jgi:predicted  nucleic acid-binding Zn-ribbon protein
MDAQLDRFANVRREMEAKIELLNVQATSKDREIAIIRSKLETATEEADKRRRQLEDSRLEASVERLKLSEKIDALRARVQEQADESMQRRLEDGREIALYKQKLEFYERKIDDLQRTCDE